MRIPILTVIVVFSICSANCSDEDKNKQIEEARWEEVRWDEAETKKYSEAFWKQYEQSEVRKQLCISLGLEELVNKPKSEIPVTMHGPNFYRDCIDGKEFGLLSLGFIAHFRVDFEAENQTKGSFVEGVTGAGKSFDTYAECRSFAIEWIDKQVESSENEKIIQQAEQGEADQPATAPELKTENNDKPQSETKDTPR